MINWYLLGTGGAFSLIVIPQVNSTITKLQPQASHSLRRPTLKSLKVDERNGIIISECRVAGPVRCEEKEYTSCTNILALRRYLIMQLVQKLNDLESQSEEHAIVIRRFPLKRLKDVSDKQS